jgi:hypothetical protein
MKKTGWMLERDKQNSEIIDKATLLCKRMTNRDLFLSQYKDTSTNKLKSKLFDIIIEVHDEYNSKRPIQKEVLDKGKSH